MSVATDIGPVVPASTLKLAPKRGTENEWTIWMRAAARALKPGDAIKVPSFGASSLYRLRRKVKDSRRHLGLTRAEYATRTSADGLSIYLIRKAT